MCSIGMKNIPFGGHIGERLFRKLGLIVLLNFATTLTSPGTKPSRFAGARGMAW
jgi:hypothetical protein